MNELELIEGTLCPVARSQHIVGDRWSVLIMRELFMGNGRFDELQAQTGATPQMLASRLKKLEAYGLLERRPYSQRPLRHEYALTAMGADFYPVILALRAWGEKWCKSEGEDVAVQYTHIPCGKNPGLGVVCPHCGIALRRGELIAQPARRYEEERKRRSGAA